MVIAGICESLLLRKEKIELRHKEKVCDGRLGGAVEEDSHLHLDTERTRGLLMVCPALEEHVASELGKEAAAAKERRKIREEQKEKAPKGGGRGAGKTA